MLNIECAYVVAVYVVSLDAVGRDRWGSWLWKVDVEVKES
jgi:hypothetical protein